MQTPDAESFESGAGISRASALLRDILDLTAAFEVEVSASLEVSRRDFEAMQHLAMSGPLSPSEIARRLGVTTAAATVLVDRLSSVGHVSREPHPTDRRAVLVVPNPDSITAAMARIRPLIMGVDHVLNDFHTAEQAVITAYLERIVDVYRKQLDFPERGTPFSTTK